VQSFHAWMRVGDAAHPFEVVTVPAGRAPPLLLFRAPSLPSLRFRDVLRLLHLDDLPAMLARLDFEMRDAEVKYAPADTSSSAVSRCVLVAPLVFSFTSPSQSAGVGLAAQVDVGSRPRVNQPNPNPDPQNNRRARSWRGSTWRPRRTCWG